MAVRALSSALSVAEEALVEVGRPANEALAAAQFAVHKAKAAVTAVGEKAAAAKSKLTALKATEKPATDKLAEHQNRLKAVTLELKQATKTGTAGGVNLKTLAQHAQSKGASAGGEIATPRGMVAAEPGAGSSGENETRQGELRSQQLVSELLFYARKAVRDTKAAHEAAQHEQRGLYSRSASAAAAGVVSASGVSASGASGTSAHHEDSDEEGGASEGSRRSRGRQKSLAPRLHNQMELVVAEADAAVLKLKSLAPLLEKLRCASRFGGNALDARTVAQTGIQTLLDLMEGKDVQCPVCHEPVALPTFTPCVHAYCAECLLSVLKARQADGASEAACPMCRQAFTKDSLIQVHCEPCDENPDDDEDSSEGEFASHNEGGGNARPAFSPAVARSEMRALVTARRPRHMAGRHHSYPLLPVQLLSHLLSSCGGLPLCAPAKQLSETAADSYSPKMQAMLAEVRRCMQSEGGGEKIVVFSQHREAIMHASAVLDKEGIKHARIAPNDKDANHGRPAEAIARFNSEPVSGCAVFLLHAGHAAAGLTLTVARRVLLLEPFQTAGMADSLNSLYTHPLHARCTLAAPSSLNAHNCTPRALLCGAVQASRHRP